MPRSTFGCPSRSRRWRGTTHPSSTGGNAAEALAPLLDATLGLAFATEDPQAETWLNEEIAKGALILADDKVRPGMMSQIVIPVDDGTVSVLFLLWGHANWLSGSLASAVVSRAELPGKVAYTLDDNAAPPGAAGEVLAALDAYAGRDPAQRRVESEQAAWSETVWRQPGANRVTSP